MKYLFFFFVLCTLSFTAWSQTPCKAPENPLGKKPRVEIRKEADKAVIRINDFPPVEYFFAPEEKNDFPGSALDAIFSDIRLAPSGEPCRFVIIGMTIRNIKKISRIYHFTTDPPVSATVAEVMAKVQTSLKREIQVSGAVEVRSSQLKIMIWDNQYVDGDSVSVFFNEASLIEHLALTKTPSVFEINLHKGANMLTLLAHNLGAAPPNTAAITIDDGKTRQTRVLSSSLHACGALELILKE